MFSVQLLFLRAPQGAHEKRSAKEARSYEKKMSLTRPRSAREFRNRNSLLLCRNILGGDNIHTGSGDVCGKDISNSHRGRNFYGF